ncbi:MAG: OmpA family protein [Roseobacter sp.]
MKYFCGLLFAISFGMISAGGPAQAVNLELPAGAKMTAQRDSVLDSFAAPIASFDGVGVAALTTEGKVIRRAWRVSLPGLTTLQVSAPLRDQAVSQGFEVIFECEAAQCGGFDFRFNTEVLPGPNMYVNISQFRYLTLRRGGAEDPDEIAGLLVSVTADSAYVQVISVLPGLVPPVRPTVITPAPSVAQSRETQSDMVAELSNVGHAVLDDLDFATGTTDLGAGPYKSLADLADFLNAQVDRRVALVGHTDAVGRLETNITLSRARAQSVRARLIDVYGADPSRISAEGMGYLAPLASNLTDSGRTRNRRVEAILLNTE